MRAGRPLPPRSPIGPALGLASVPMAEEHISLSEASRRAGVSPSTLKRWAAAKVEATLPPEATIEVTLRGFPAPASLFVVRAAPG